MSDDIVLQRGDYALALRPQVGGSVARFTWRGMDVFRPSADGATAPTDMAMFPIAPYVNRIAHGRFEAGGEPVRLDLNFGAHPHALHGHAWQSPWAVTAREGARAHLRFTYAPGDWPWPYVCRQDILVTEQGAEFTLSLENLSDEPMPAGVGFHPYFPHRTETIVCANVEGMWAVDETILPTELAAPIIPLGAGAHLADAPFIDNTFTGWDGRAALQSTAIAITIDASPTFGFFHLYAPQNADFFCAEPVSAMPDAVNRRDTPGHGLRLLAPNAVLSASMRITASAP